MSMLFVQFFDQKNSGEETSLQSFLYNQRNHARKIYLTSWLFNRDCLIFHSF